MPLALGTVPISARVVGNLAVAALLAAIDVPAQGFGLAVHDGRGNAVL